MLTGLVNLTCMVCKIPYNRNGNPATEIKAYFVFTERESDCLACKAVIK